MVLGYSRFLWGRYCPNQKLAAVLRELCGNVGDGICSGGGVIVDGFDAVGEFDAFDHFGQLVLPIKLAP